METVLQAKYEHPVEKMRGNPYRHGMPCAVLLNTTKVTNDVVFREMMGWPVNTNVHTWFPKKDVEFVFMNITDIPEIITYFSMKKL